MTEISKGIKQQDPKSVFEVENTPGKSQKTSPSFLMAGCPSKAHESRTRSPAGAVGIGPRRTKSKNAGLGSIVPLAAARTAAQ